MCCADICHDFLCKGDRRVPDLQPAESTCCTPKSMRRAGGLDLEGLVCFRVRRIRDRCGYEVLSGTRKVPAGSRAVPFSGTRSAQMLSPVSNLNSNAAPQFSRMLRVVRHPRVSDQNRLASCSNNNLQPRMLWG
jgi:hypothetical protein